MMRLGGVSGPLPASLRPTLDPDLSEALEMYNLMGGLEWSALPIMFAMFDIKDPAATIVRLAIIRDAANRPRDNGPN